MGVLGRSMLVIRELWRVLASVQNEKSEEKEGKRGHESAGTGSLPDDAGNDAGCTLV